MDIKVLEYDNACKCLGKCLHIKSFEKDMDIFNQATT